jgi:hypothetical protein
MAGGAKQLQQGEQSNNRSGSEVTTAGGAKRLQQGKQSNYSRGNEATSVGSRVGIIKKIDKQKIDK